MDPYLADEEQRGAGFDPVALLRLFWRRKWLFVVPFILCLAMAAVAIKTMTPVYYSAGQIRIVIDDPVTRMIEDPSGFQSRRFWDLNAEAMVRIEQVVTAPRFLERVVQNLGLHRDAVGIEAKAPGTEANVLSAAEQRAIRAQASKLRAAVRVENPDHLIYDFGVRDTDPEQAYEKAQAILDEFLAQDRQVRMQRSTTTLDFLNRQRETYAEALREAEGKLTAFQRDRLSTSLADNPISYDNLTIAEEALPRLRDQYYNQDAAQIADLEQQAAAIFEQLPPVDRYAQDTEVATIVRRIAELEIDQLIEPEGKRGSGTVANELGRLRIRLNGLVENRIAIDYPQLAVIDRNTVVRYVYFTIYGNVMQQTIRRLSRAIQEFRDFTARQPEQSQRLNELQGDVATSRSLLTEIETDITQLTINIEASRSEVGYRIEVRRDPRVNWSPVEPNKLKLAFMGFALSVAMGLGLVVLSVLLDRSFTTVEEIESVLGLPVIGTLPVIRDDRFEKRRRLRLVRWTVLVLVVLAVATVGLLYVYPKLS